MSVFSMCFVSPLWRCPAGILRSNGREDEPREAETCKWRRVGGDVKDCTEKISVRCVLRVAAVPQIRPALWPASRG